MLPATDAPPLPSAHAARLREVGGGFLRLRPWVTGPAMLTAVALLADAPMPPRQRLALYAGFAAMFAFFATEAWLLRRRTLSERWLFVSLVATAVALTVACVASGGAQSPVVPLLFAPTVTVFAAFGRRRQSTIAFALLVAALLAIAFVPGFPPLPRPQRSWLLLVFAFVSGALLRISVARLAEAFQETTGRLARAHEEVVAAAEARARVLETVGARVAHEIKNPLAAVKGLVGLLAQDPGGPRAPQRLEVVAAEVERIEALVRDYLTFARPLDDLRRDRVDLAAIVADAAAVLEARAARADVRLEADGPTLWLDADPRRLKEALLNLIGNAIEAGGDVRVTWGAVEGGVRLEVRDAGRGMDAATLARVGTPFFTTHEGGTGLGVALARAVVAQHGGALAYDSAPGRGTTVVMTLPGSA